MYTCDLCAKDHWESASLRTIQSRSKEYGSIWTWVVCAEPCADKIRDDPDSDVLTDEPFRGEYTEGRGYV